MIKIERMLLQQITVYDYSDIKNEKELKVIVYYNNKNDISKILKQLKISEIYYYKIIKAVGLSITPKTILELSKYNVVEYITSASKVQTLMDRAKQTINISKWHENNILGQDKTLAIIDTGVAPHIDFLSYKNRIKFFHDFINDKKEFYDDNGHGTFVSGVALGNGFASGGKYCGIAPQSKLVMLKALDRNGEASALSVLKAMEWIFDNAKNYDIDVVCMSFGSNPLDKNDPLSLGVSSLIDNRGITVVVAAGNSGPESRTIKSPGVNNKAITVGGVDDRMGDNNLTVPDFSSRGPAYSFYKPDLLSPAVDIVSTSNDDNNIYTIMSGTSVATPIVAGTALLIKQIYPNLTPGQVKRLLLSNTILLPQNIGGGRNKQGYGVLKIKN